MTRVFVVLSTYYKHGEADTVIFTDVAELEEYLIEQIQRYDESWSLDDLEDDEYDVEDEEEMIYALIKTVVRMGKEQVSEQIGSGIIKITEITTGIVKNVDVDVYSFD